MNLDIPDIVRDPNSTTYSDLTASVLTGPVYQEENETWTFPFNPEITNETEMYRIKLRLRTTPEEEQLYIDAWQVMGQLQATAGFTGTATAQQLTDQVKLHASILNKLIPLVLTKFEGLYQLGG